MTPLDRIARFERDLVVQAGAGTGKTHALVTLYLHLVAGLTAARRRVPPSRIAVVTFTDKAAGELKERLRARLGKLISDPSARHEPTLVAAARELGLPAVILPTARDWTQALAELGGAPVGTFHSFAGALLRRHAARLGLEPDFRLLDEAESAASAVDAAERAILDALDRHPGGEVAQLVGEYGYHATGRGVGLVEELVRIRAQRAEEGRSAAGLDRGYSQEALDADWAAACRRFTDGVRGLAELAAELGGKSAELARELGARRFDPRDPPALLDSAAALVDELKKLRNHPSLPPLKETLREAGEALVEAHASRRAAPLAAALARLVEAVETGYADHKRRAGAVDFADLLVRARDLLRDHADLQKSTRARFDAVLVDEFQDTNPVQAELIELVAGDPQAGGGRRFVVGDRKQSIYEFRGADVAVFTRFARTLLERGGAEELLRQSRRSAPSVLRLSNALFARAMVPAHAGAEWETWFEPARDDLEPERDDVPLAGAELLVVDGDSSGIARAREARAIAARIHGLRAAGRRWGEVAILLRRFTHLGDYLDALRVAQVPYFVVRGRGFFSAQEIRDLASALTLLDDPDDRLALVSVLRSPLVGLSDETLARLAFERRLRAGLLLDDAGTESLPDGERERLAGFRARFRELRLRADRLGPAACLRELVEAHDLPAVLVTTRDGEQRVANLERLIERARAFESSGGDLRGFVGWLRRAAAGGEGDAAQAQIVDERDDVVRVMTVHQAKGLEFPIVFVPGCGAPERRDFTPVLYHADLGVGLSVEDERSPGRRVHSTPSRRVRTLRDARQRAESLRLFYVAATRARDLVVFSGERTPQAADSWRAHLDALAGDPRTAPLLRRIDGGTLSAPRPEDSAAASPPGDEAAARRRLRVIVDRPAPSPRRLTAAVTQLADFQLCARRYHQFHALGLLEHPASARAASSEPLTRDGDGAPALDPLRRGTLAHRLLERCDFARGGEDLDALLAADGYDPAEPDVADVRAHVTRFLATDFAQRLARVPLRRELPFLLSVPLASGGRLQVRGQIDLLLLEQHAVTVIDYKHARAGDPDDYRFQLDAYALAVRRLYPSAPSVRVGLAFLKDPDPAPRVIAAPPSDAVEASLAALGLQLADARARESWDGRPLDYCQRLHCGYVYRCHPEVAR
ncbi:MAG TPA: UvrD-helicase domain-containing protein [Polyangia bacterium]|nr:UvrD-helicase domain-containing protein [Polyangia bacterium]